MMVSHLHHMHHHGNNCKVILWLRFSIPSICILKEATSLPPEALLALHLHLSLLLVSLFLFLPSLEEEIPSSAVPAHNQRDTERFLFLVAYSPATKLDKEWLRWVSRVSELLLLIVTRGHKHWSMALRM